ncbi:formylglycine-generating enzyme family protein [Phytoactinopolyspora mesophila]|uniref:SUMF1/EgtB/PvdO family nonheme iron enzyme n=1 Tax=Phytoactinopolyspora mesophila TaxID=2650750 RepID=A0A7K3LX56_9ACTN|nr:SUMF1/EgtB/PvdO family nonheme iron enzyme [Phytoactinopolyspora mesophila]NDL55596.1 SUMF1/EgtB/PvdO family nonheme iron enzyme [Phytoactinopolyspora mesophila]
MQSSIADYLIGLPSGEITLRDEGTRSDWRVEVGAFQLMRWPVTREMYGAGTGEVPAGAAGASVPITDVSWLDAVRYCNVLSEAEGLQSAYAIGDDPDGLDVAWDEAADGYRLPSEAEWEYACRAGSAEARYGELDEIGWYRGNSGGAVHDVATKAPNAWGLHDLIGNVWEWCWDLYDPSVYGPYRVFRGGGAYDPPRGCRASCRRKSHPTFRIDDLGFRLAQAV